MAKTHKACTGALAETEQHVPQWDRVNPRTRILERAVLDVATRHPRDGHLLYMDARVTCELTTDPQRLRARANRDGAAANESVNEKHVRYPGSRVPGAELVAFVMECGGRPAEAVESMVQYWSSTAAVPELS
eukprot:4970206-Karenia_brevis.AAC.1